MSENNLAVGESQECSPVADSPEIAVSDLFFSYNNRKIFASFSLASSKRRVVLKGPSGCGKTTLLRILFGSLRANAEACLPHFNKSMLVLQEDGLFPWLTGRSNILNFTDMSASYMESHSLYPVVASFLDRPAHQMSYGQRRATELFRAILYRPEIIYLDEPFNYLDDSRASALISSLLEVSSSFSRLVITTHRHDHFLDSVSDVFIFRGEPPYSSLERSS